MTVRIRENAELIAAVRASLRDHPAIKRYAAERNLDEARVRDLIEEPVIKALEELGTAYSAEMTSVVEHMTRVRAEVHQVYERALSGAVDPADPAALRNLMSQLHEDMGRLADPETWARRQKPSAGEPTAAARYPAVARPELVGGPSNAPGAGTPIAGTSQRWRRRVVSLDEIVQVTDLATRETYWRFPDLNEGEVLEFESGYRVWRHPGGAIEEEIVAGESMSAFRRETRGEEAIHSARDMSPQHLSAAMHRAHGAGSPGLGMDAPYGLALAPQEINLRFENAGVEQWVRNLRDNAPQGPQGVQYVYRTTTRARAQTLLERTYRVSAIHEGRLYDMYEFTIGMKPKGLTDADVEFRADTLRVFEGADRFTAPLDEAATAQTGVPTRVEPPKVLREALGRLGRAGREVPRAVLTRAYERLASLRETVQAKLLGTVGESRPGPGSREQRLREAMEAKRLGTAAGDVRRSEALFELTEALDATGKVLDSGPLDEARLTAVADALEGFNRRAARWPDQVTEQQIRALAAQLRGLRR